MDYVYGSDLATVPGAQAGERAIHFTHCRGHPRRPLGLRTNLMRESQEMLATLIDSTQELLPWEERLVAPLFARDTGEEEEEFDEEIDDEDDDLDDDFDDEDDDLDDDFDDEDDIDEDLDDEIDEEIDDIDVDDEDDDLDDDDDDLDDDDEDLDDDEI
ncbi:hypothetical protein [Singulisphaera sp. PoT]|uniref:hypothetical protein n=1 Tax=Singulisphaera sp. PoT TaxID=3411797 RepID=UPI003BF53BA4